jgi:hypothetical protein
MEMTLSIPKTLNRCMSCDVHGGLPTAKGNAWSYYVSNHRGHQMLVSELSKGDRVRINDATDVIILEIHDGQIKIGIQRLADSVGDPKE